MATLRDAYQLLHEGSLVLADIEGAGMRIDMDYLQETIRETDSQIAKTEAVLRADEVYEIMQKKYGAAVNLGSRKQVAYAIFDILGYECKAYTATNRQKLDVEALEDIDHPFAVSYIKNEKLKKLRHTYLQGILSEAVDGYLHPFFNLHTVQTYRGSSSNPNFQNIPIRDPVIGKLVRGCFIPRPGHQIMEIDEASIEVRISACYHHDENMIRYIKDPTSDMHRDMAAECYMLDTVPKSARQQTKSLFVFAQFYGDVYTHCAAGLWEAIDRHKLKTADGVHMKDHLASKGIINRGACNARAQPLPKSFEAHIKNVEHNFWNSRFPQYRDWKKRLWADYKSAGKIKMLTGFEVSGVYRKNEILNSPIQGTAFQCLLWSMIQIHNWLKANNMRTQIIGQIHDSIVFDAHPDETAAVASYAKYIMTELIQQHWPWIIVPLDVEAEVAPVDHSWYHKAPYAIQ